MKKKKKYWLKMPTLISLIGFLIMFGLIPLNLVHAQEDENDIIIDTDTTWEAGVYNYDKITITDGATLTLNGAVTLNCANLIIDLSSSISANGRGYQPEQGPGAGISGSGAGYGGKGGDDRIGSPGGVTYGSLYNPTDLGSGGGNGGSGWCNWIMGGAGGGLIKITIATNFILNGELSANGCNGDDGVYGKYGWYYMEAAGGGSGGSIWINTNTLTGTGSIQANGGNGGHYEWDTPDNYFGGGGGGGRIAIYYNISTFSGDIVVKGGLGAQNGEDGTINTTPQKWSFAIITDLHIGFDIPDYDGYSYDDASAGQDYYLSKRLEVIVDRINELKNIYNIKFVPVLGDISDTAEYSELLKARNILNKLNDPNGDGNLEDGIPYIPLIGNHDVWPYTQKEGIDPDIRGEENHATIANSAIGDEYFEGIFWCSFNTLAETKEECLAKNKNPQKIKELFGKLSRQENNKFPYLQNYAFSYKELSFIFLDYIEVARKSKPGYKEILPQNLPLTTGWLNYNLLKYKNNPIILFSHDPYFIDNYSLKLSDKYFLFAGHIHDRICNDNIADESNPKCKSMAKFRFNAIPTEAILEEYENIIRIVQVKNIENPIKEDIDYSEIEGIPKEIAPDDIKCPDPYIIYLPSNPTPNEEITFTVKDEVREKDIKSCKWNFGDGITDNSGKCKIIHQYSPLLLWRYTVKVTITYVDETQRIAEKSIWVKPKFKLKVPMLIFPSLLIDEEINVAQNPQNTPESVLITKTASEKKPIGIIGVHFEEATRDIDLSNLVADIDLETKKSILYMPDWPEEIEENKILFIPSSGIGKVYICPRVTSIAEVTPLCIDSMILNTGESKDEMWLSNITYNGREYYIVLGIKGTGGGEFGIIEKSIKDINDYIQNLSGEAFKNNHQQRKNALKNKLEEVFVKIENEEYQDAINKLKNDVRAKTDGDSKTEDWIINPEVQREILIMIDNLVIYLQGLL